MYETLLNEAEQERIDVIEYLFQGRLKGLYYNRTIGIHKNATAVEKACVLAEELGHYHTSGGTSRIKRICRTGSRRIKLGAGSMNAWYGV